MVFIQEGECRVVKDMKMKPKGGAAVVAARKEKERKEAAEKARLAAIEEAKKHSMNRPGHQYATEGSAAMAIIDKLLKFMDKKLIRITI